MSTVWIEGAERLGKGSIGGAMDYPGKPPRAVWHTTESGAGDGAFNAVARVLIANGDEPHILYDPTTDRIGQFGPLNESARALKNDGATRTNRVGKVCIQVEVLARAGTPFTGYWKPGKNFRKLMDAIRSWGVPDVWPMGALADHYGDPDAKRTRDVWLTKGGHYGHCNIPGNDHWDPGAIDRAAFFRAAPRVVAKPPAPVIPPHAPAKPAPAPKPSVSLRRIIAASKRDPGLPDGGTTFKADVLVVERALKAEGLLDGKYVDGSFGKRTQAAYREWQKRLGYRGTAADGIPGKVSLGKLGAKRGFVVKD